MDLPVPLRPIRATNSPPLDLEVQVGAAPDTVAEGAAEAAVRAGRLAQAAPLSAG